MLLRLDGLEVWVGGARAAPGEAAALVAGLGRALRLGGEPPRAGSAADAAASISCSRPPGDARLMVATLGLLRRNGVACCSASTAAPATVTLDGRVLGVDSCSEPRAHRQRQRHADDWRAAVAALEPRSRAWPDAVEQFVGLRVPPDRFGDAFAYRGVKATLAFAG